MSLGQLRLAMRSVAAMQLGNHFGRQFGLGSLDPVVGLETSDDPVQCTVGQPESGGHGPPRFQERTVFDDDRTPIGTSDHDVETPERPSPQQTSDELFIG